MIERLLDSVILIDHFNGISGATQFISGLDPVKTAISVITRAEILVGFDEESIEKPRALLDQFVLFNIDKETADKAAALRREHGWKLPDAFQAAISLLAGIRLSTRNTKDFDPSKHGFVEVPYLI
ncbi:MAG: PIN domain-containing protein [Thermodesulfobacteriota bacterium]